MRVRSLVGRGTKIPQAKKKKEKALHRPDAQWLGYNTEALPSKSHVTASFLTRCLDLQCAALPLAGCALYIKGTDTSVPEASESLLPGKDSRKGTRRNTREVIYDK